MKAQELRIGNFVSNPPLSEFRVIDYLDIRDFAEGRLIQPFEPIPLTEDWLKRFGFEDKNGYQHPCYRKDLILIYGRPENKWCVVIGGGINSFESTDKQMHVHQLQNLYFALTGTELKLN